MAAKLLHNQKTLYDMQGVTNSDQPEAKLSDRLRAMIQADGPIPVSVFMQLALFDRKQGYYATRPGLGSDFTTAPEISQVFGEMLGLWVAHEWQQLGHPSPCYLIEFGPGRGIMMRDVWRAASKTKGFSDAVQPYLVEPSPALIKIQKENLSTINNPKWVDSIESIPPGPSIILANEVLDCLPIRQYVRNNGAWCERKIGLDKLGNFQFGISASLGAESEQAITQSSGLSSIPNTLVQDVVEISTALDAFIEMMSERLAMGDSRALFIDYGPANSTPADTLRAYSKGQQVDPLSHPGEVDLTADVDFARVAITAEKYGLKVAGPTPQGWFLNALGGVERVNALINQNPSKADQISEGALRIMSPEHMGQRFQVICLSSKDTPQPAGF